MNSRLTVLYKNNNFKVNQRPEMFSVFPKVARLDFVRGGPGKKFSRIVGEMNMAEGYRGTASPKPSRLGPPEPCDARDDLGKDHGVSG